MNGGDSTLDPRVRRTRHALREALERLLVTHGFEAISVQDIAAAADVNRATFYGHFPDKYALLESMVDARFEELLRQRGIAYVSGCTSALRAIVLGVCDYLSTRPRADCERHRQMEPHLESAVIAVVRRTIASGLESRGAAGRVPAPMIATTASWAIYGAAKEWIETPNRGPAESIVDTLVSLVSPILDAAALVVAT